ncbi:hypothetical protein [Mesorhizobium sp. 43Arga]
MWKPIFVVKTRREAFSALPVAPPNRDHSFYAPPIFRGDKLCSYAAKAAFHLGDIAIGFRRLCPQGKVLK